jgi:hypothetical protein
MENAMKRKLKMDERNKRRREEYADRKFQEMKQKIQDAEDRRWIATHEIATSR